MLLNGCDMRIRIVVAIFPTLFSVAVLACAPVRDVDKSSVASRFLSRHQECTLPCWLMITPHETKFEDAISILEQNQNTQVNYVSSTSVEFISDGASGSIDAAKNGLVDYIILILPDSPLEDLLTVAGAPAKIRLVLIPYVTGVCNAVLVFPDNGIIAEVTVEAITDSDHECVAEIDQEAW